MKEMTLTVDQLIEHISSNLEQDANESASVDEKLIKAAILVPLFLEQGTLKLLYIHRSDIGELHRGEVAFPGGSVEPEDANNFQTALRETKEELGIEAPEIQILGRLPQLPTVTKYAVTPVVGKLNWPTKISQNYIEVERFFSIPLNWLMDENNWEEKTFEIPNRGTVSTIVYKTYDHEILWGFTAKVTQMLIELIKKGER
jgi:8-oxo-dGTP pyrophosphatase MutT (NUDIX family)